MWHFLASVFAVWHPICRAALKHVPDAHHTASKPARPRQNRGQSLRKTQPPRHQLHLPRGQPTVSQGKAGLRLVAPTHQRTLEGAGSAFASPDDAREGHRRPLERVPRRPTRRSRRHEPWSTATSVTVGGSGTGRFRRRSPKVRHVIAGAKHDGDVAAARVVLPSRGIHHTGLCGRPNETDPVTSPFHFGSVGGRLRFDSRPASAPGRLPAAYSFMLGTTPGLRPRGTRGRCTGSPARP